jgi:hypothetical protein
MLALFASAIPALTCPKFLEVAVGRWSAEQGRSSRGRDCS